MKIWIKAIIMIMIIAVVVYIAYACWLGSFSPPAPAVAIPDTNLFNSTDNFNPFYKFPAGLPRT